MRKNANELHAVEALPSAVRAVHASSLRAGRVSCKVTTGQSIVTKYRGSAPKLGQLSPKISEKLRLKLSS
jgi:hypothetical protein